MADDPMWCLVMFDLPTKTAEQRREYSNFRNYLLDNGFVRIQYSVYARFSPQGVTGSRIIRAIKATVPPGGEVRAIHISDRQWASALRFFNAAEKKPEEEPEQLAFF
ncbi:CRISPR-associated endonuclease Cas2 [Actinomycetaceae bacterium L2_0104]